MLDLLFIAILIVTALLAATVLVVPATSLALIVTACGILLTWRTARAQRVLAERKLFLDLMPRRAEWYDRVKAALEGRARERNELVTQIHSGQMPSHPKHLAKLWQLETEAGWLFSSEMVAMMALLIEADKQVVTSQLEARQGNMEAAVRLSGETQHLYDQQAKVQEYLVGYLYVGDIGKPKRAPIQMARVQRKLLPWRRGK